MVMVETPDDVLVVGELYNPILRGQLQLFICDIESDSAYTGISMFLLMALMKRIKVFVWCGLQRRDILQEYAPWALDAISAEAQFEAIGCTCRVDSETGDRTLHVAEESGLINHWVACINSRSSHGDGENCGEAPTVLRDSRAVKAHAPSNRQSLAVAIT